MPALNDAEGGGAPAAAAAASDVERAGRAANDQAAPADDVPPLLHRGADAVLLFEDGSSLPASTAMLKVRCGGGGGAGAAPLHGAALHARMGGNSGPMLPPLCGPMRRHAPLTRPPTRAPPAPQVHSHVLNELLACTTLKRDAGGAGKLALPGDARGSWLLALRLLYHDLAPAEVPPLEQLGSLLKLADKYDMRALRAEVARVIGVAPASLETAEALLALAHDHALPPPEPLASRLDVMLRKAAKSMRASEWYVRKLKSYCPDSNKDSMWRWLRVAADNKLSALDLFFDLIWERGYTVPQGAKLGAGGAALSAFMCQKWAEKQEACKRAALNRKDAAVGPDAPLGAAEGEPPAAAEAEAAAAGAPTAAD